MKGQNEFKHELLQALSHIVSTFHLIPQDTKDYLLHLAGKDFVIQIALVREGLKRSTLICVRAPTGIISCWTGT